MEMQCCELIKMFYSFSHKEQILIKYGGSQTENKQRNKQKLKTYSGVPLIYSNAL